MRQIQLTKGKIALVDDSDYDWLMEWSWYAGWNGRAFYARRDERHFGTRVRIFMHRQILGLAPGRTPIVDHFDRNTLNNQRFNIQPVSQSLNHVNSNIRINKRTAFKGVDRIRTGKWRARIHFTENGRQKEVHLGLFETPMLAAVAYDNALSQRWGEFALTNAKLGLL